jgi:hypothetical protein
MTQIKNIFQCPRCDHDITSIGTTTSCPSCGLPLGNSHVDPYTPPYTFTEQHTKLEDTEQYVKTLTDLNINKANNIVNDALTIFETIAGKNTSVSGIGSLVRMGIRIGEIAKAYDNFLSVGGKHVPSYFIKTPPGESNVTETIGDGKKPSSSPSDPSSVRMG